MDAVADFIRSLGIADADDLAHPVMKAGGLSVADWFRQALTNE
jgi:hypothetical protein